MKKNLFNKIWESHLVEEREDGTSLIYIDRHLIHEVTSPQAFEGLRLTGRKVRRPDLTLAVADHNIPTEGRINGIKDKLANIKPGDWILGFGWDQNLWEDKSFPFATFLNNIAPNNPIYLTRIDGHAAWVNDVSILKTKLDSKQLNEVDGGKVINDCIMIDNSMLPFKNCLPNENKKQVVLKKCTISLCKDFKS